MGEWSTYSLEDFLLFAPRAYWRMVELHNAALWPLPLLLALLGVGLAVLACRRQGRQPGRAVGLGLALCWVLVAWQFFWLRYATINWAAPHVAAAFLVEAALLAALPLRFDQDGPARWFAWPLIAWGVAGHSLASPLLGRPWEWFGWSPDPTAAATLGLLLLARGRARLLALPVPLAWCLVSAATLATMEAAGAWIPLAAAAFALVGLLATAGRGLRP